VHQYGVVSQEDEWGCAAACVASLMRVDYKRAKRWLEKAKGKGIDSKPAGFEIDEIANALFEQGFKVVADWNPPEALPDGAIVCIHSRVRYQYYHYLLKVPGGYMDPWYDLLDVGKDEKRVGKFRESLPSGTRLVVALLPSAQ